MQRARSKLNGILTVTPQLERKMETRLMIPEWVGSILPNAASLDYSKNVRDIYAAPAPVNTTAEKRSQP